MTKFIASFLLVIAFVTSSTSSMAKRYKIIDDKSEIAFSGLHADEPFDGVFKEWEANITWDSDRPENAQIIIRVELDSAKTGNITYDKTLPRKDWFWTDKHPKALFRVDTITRGEEEGDFIAKGFLRMRGVERPLEFDFKIEDIDKETKRVTANFPIDRLAYDIGKESDSEGKWVSKDIMITVDITAKE